MTTAETDGRRLSDDQLAELLGLLDEVDSVELKLTVPESDQRSTVMGLGMDPLLAQIRQVYFFDTPDLALDRAGVVVRARRVQGREDDTVIKLRPVVPADLPSELRRSPDLLVEVDAMPGGFVCSASLRSRCPDRDVRAALAGDRPLRKLFTKTQRALFAEHAPPGVGFEDLVVLGPLVVLKLKFSPEGYAGRLVAEMWLYPDGSRILELSTKCAPRDGIDTAIRTRLFLRQNGVPLSGEQQTKTRAALDYFSGLLDPGPVAA